MAKQHVVKEWVELNASGPLNRKDEAAQVLICYGTSAVLEVDDDKGLKLKTYVEPQVFAKIKGSIKKALKAIGWKFSFSGYSDEDWPLRWKRSIKPMAASAFFIRPTWSKAKPKAGCKTITLDPGQAFGTGSHHTTRMCLKALALLLSAGGKKRSLLSPKKIRLLDVGTGSAILAIAGKLLGVKDVLGTDNDPVALSVARKNRSLNKVSFALSGKDISKLTGRYDVVVANILSSTLSEMKDELIGKVKPNGYLILSGILKVEGDDLSKQYLKAGMKLYKRFNSGEWTSFIMVKGREI